MKKALLVIVLVCSGYYLTLFATADNDSANDSPASSTDVLEAPASTQIPNHAVILLYHHVATNTPALTSISPKQFEQQLAYLSHNNFQVWPLNTIIHFLQSKKNLPDKVIGISFDDNYQSVYDHAYPLLKKYSFPFTIFVSTDAIDDGYNFQSSWEQLRIMRENGASIANHSSQHQHMLVKLPDETDQQWRQRIKTDIKKAEQRIAKETGENLKLFAYPYGEYNEALSGIIEELGYTGFGQHSGAVGETTNFLTIPRFPFAGQYTKPEDFELKVKTLPLPVDAVIAPSQPLNHEIARPELIINFRPGHKLQTSLRCFGSNQGELKLEWQNQNRLRVHPDNNIPVGRSRYNCTASFNTSGADQRFYWHSHPWLRLDKNNRWILD